jgi:hypothetical protein
MIICTTSEEVALRAMARRRGGRKEMILPRGLTLSESSGGEACKRNTQQAGQQ